MGLSDADALIDPYSSAWALSAPERLRWREWDGEVVVLVPATGNTHLLSDVGAVVFQTFLEAHSALSLQALETLLVPAEASKGAIAEAPDHAVRDLLRTTLLEFERIGFVERVSS